MSEPSATLLAEIVALEEELVRVSALTSVSEETRERLRIRITEIKRLAGMTAKAAASDS